MQCNGNGMASIGKRFYCLFFGLVWKQIQQEQEYIFLTWFCEEKDKKSAETDFLHLDLGLPPHPLLCTLLHLLHLGINLGCCTFTITSSRPSPVCKAQLFTCSLMPTMVPFWSCVVTQHVSNTGETLHTKKYWKFSFKGLTVDSWHAYKSHTSLLIAMCSYKNTNLPKREVAKLYCKNTCWF